MGSTNSVAHVSSSDAGLNLLWPGLAQLCQKRFAPAVLFSLQTALACALFVWSPPRRPMAILALVVVTIWSIVDACAHERRA